MPVNVMRGGKWTCEQVAMALEEDIMDLNVRKVAVIYQTADGTWDSIIGAAEDSAMLTGDLLIACEVLRRRALKDGMTGFYPED